MPQERILVVDDEESVRSVVAALLERSGYAATTIEGAEQAIARLQQDPDYDLVLSDIMMQAPTASLCSTASAPITPAYRSSCSLR